ncbi:MAG: MotA/TolQ/ExbB proton channel family protein [Verrucomicrobia bacterium]|nr:MotA/TolQ/ExbB proton channel family protein [Verrucomicrobiota bacterium]
MDIFFILALLFTSVIALTFIVERGFALRWQKVVPSAVESAVGHYHSDRDLGRLRHICQHHPSAFSRLLLMAADHVDWPKAENINLLEKRARHEVVKLERGLVVLEIIVGISPLLGLVGTIYGLIILFGSMDQGNASDTTRFAQGISLALNATLMGLLIAIPTLVAWSYYSKKVENLTIEMETLCDEFLRRHYGATESPELTPKVVPHSFK